MIRKNVKLLVTKFKPSSKNDDKIKVERTQPARARLATICWCGDIACQDHS